MTDPRLLTVAESCGCPAKPGEPCPLSELECLARIQRTLQAVLPESELPFRVTHIRHERSTVDDPHSLCGIETPIESISFRHCEIAYGGPDLVQARHVTVDRAASIRFGLDTLPNRMCDECMYAFEGRNFDGDFEPPTVGNEVI